MARQKIEIPADLNQGYTAPEGADITTLRDIAAEAQATAIQLLEKDNYTDEDLAKAQWLATVIDTCNGQVEAIEAVDNERRAKADELRAKIKPAEAVEDDAPAEDEDPEGGTGPQAAQAQATDAAPELVVAAAPKIPSIADVARRAPKAEVQARRGRASIVAAADVPGFAAGSELSDGQLGQAWESRTRSFEGLKGHEGTFSAHVARVRIESPDEGLVASGENLTKALDYACDEKRLATEKGQGSLVAAGGWCAPTEPLYDLLNLMSSDGLIDLPTITARRGGLQWATGPDFTAVWGGGQEGSLTEAQAISGTTKPKANIPCPSTTSKRMGVDVLYLTGDILSQQGWPEAYADFITKAQIVFQHYISAQTIGDIVTGSTAVDMSTFTSNAAATQFGAISTVLGAVQLQVEDMKYRGRLSRGQSVECVLPYFARGLMRADAWKRGYPINDDVLTDAYIDSLFAQIGVNVQYVYDWQDNVTDATNQTGFGGATAIGAWPATFKVLLYPSGTWARALEPVIDLSAVYDSTLLNTNQYVALFQEQGRLTIKRGFDSRIVKVASNPNGATGGTVAATTVATI